MKSQARWEQIILAVSAAMMALLLPWVGYAADGAGKPTSPTGLDRGRYLVKVSGCNDCHTAGYTAKDGQVPEREWLKGDTLCWRGPWGTTDAANVRLYMQHVTEV